MPRLYLHDTVLKLSLLLIPTFKIMKNLSFIFKQDELCGQRDIVAILKSERVGCAVHVVWHAEHKVIN